MRLSPALSLARRELATNRTQHGASVVVAAVGSLLGSVLIEAEVILQQQSSGGGFYVHPFVPLLIGVLGIVFVIIATFVAVIVTANTFAIVMAGRARRTALLRLLGATADTLRRAVAVEGAAVGLVGSVLGTAIGALAAAVTSGVLIGAHVFLPLAMDLVPWQLVFPVVVGVIATTVAAWVGTRSIVEVSPIQALGRIAEPAFEKVRTQVRGRRTLIVAAAVVGFVLLLLGVGVGAVSPFGLLIAVPGGAISFLAFIAGSDLFLPLLLRWLGRLGGGSAPFRLAAANALRYPIRTSRSTIGLIIGITLVTMFGVAGQTYTDVAGRVNAGLPQSEQDAVSPFLGLVLGIIVVLVSFSLIIAAVGLINSLRLSVLQRTQEIGLLRALGFSRGQTRTMIFAESLQLSVAGTACGLVLGIVYGWAGALAAIASDHHIGGYFWPSVPWYLLVAVVLAAALLAVVSSLLPARYATRISPIRAATV